MVKTMRPVIGAVIFNVLTTQAMAEETRFFSSGIDFWQAKEVPDQAKKNVGPEETPIQEKTKDQEVKQAPFDWQKFSSPKNNEFFKEGDYLPPEPFMEVSRNPSDENIRQWFAYIEQKNNLTERLTRRIDEYVKKNPTAAAGFKESSVTLPVKSLPDVRRFRFRFYFSSTCPHCQKMFVTVNDLVSRGYFVEVRQVDQGPLDKISSPVPVIQASRGDIAKFHIDAVPLLLAADLKSGSVFRQKGYIDAETLLGQLHIN